MQLWWATGDQDDRALHEVCHAQGRWLLRVDAQGARLLDRDNPAHPERDIRPDVLDTLQMTRLRELLHTQSGSVAKATSTVTDFAVEIGSTARGQSVVFDITTHGPHLVVSGMTGSGKSTLLTSWMRDMCRQLPAERLEFVVIDFKGGLDFLGLSHLEHCVGLATDADEESIDRALDALSNELTIRERHVRQGKTSDDLPRLIVILDEFRATAQAHPRAVSLVIDLVARGRALGVHVVLSTQRASTSVSEDILANVPTRLAFRALSLTESTFLVGTPDAYRRLREPGEAIVMGIAHEPTFVRMKAPTETFETVAGNAIAPSLRRQLWTPSLPVRVCVEDASIEPRFVLEPNDVAARDQPTTTSAVLGLIDVLERRRWESAWYEPRDDGHLLSVGATRHCRESFLRAVESQLSATSSVRTVSTAVELWDLIDPRCANHEIPDVVVIPDVHAVFDDVRADARDDLSERLIARLRSPGHQRFIIGCDAAGVWPTRLGAVCRTRVDIGHDVRRANRGLWREHPIALVDDPMSREPVVPPRAPTVMPDAVLVIAPSVESIDALSSSIVARNVRIEAIATASTWQANLTQWMQVSESSTLLVPALHPSDARVLLREWSPLPPVGPNEMLVLYPNRTYARFALDD